MKFIPSLDGVRAVAVLLVILGHAYVPLVSPSVGVTIFFFLSGYLITTLLRIEYAKHGRISLRDFYLRRTLRILPPLYFTLAVIFVMVSLGLLSGGIEFGGTMAAIFHFANYWQIFADQQDLPRGSGVFWSVAVEEHFYLLFPILYITMLSRGASRRTQGLVLAALCLASMLWRCILTFGFHVDLHWTYYGTDTRAESILLGCLLAIAANPYLDPVRLPRKLTVRVLFPGAVAVLYGITKLHADIQQSVGFTLQGACLAVIIITVVAFPDTLVGRFLNWRPVAYFGVLSFGLYLVHRLFQIPLDEHLDQGWAVVSSVSLVGSILVAHLMHVWIERPATRLRKRLSHTVSNRKATTPPAMANA